MALDFSFLDKFQTAFALGLWMTIRITVVCVILGTALGFLTGLARTSRSRILRGVATAYVDVFRGTPVLIQLFWIFFCLPLILGTEPPNFVSACIALTLYMGAITSESFRSSLRQVGREQMDACVALGLPPRARILNVILPQAVLRAIPPLLSNAISLFKESALVSAVGVADLMFVGQNISNNTAKPVEVLTFVALVYFVIAFPLTRLVSLVERKMLRKIAA
ncbi:amino acid ABC transporter permease [Amaricoccus solimangrovi]|uniref:Amino acid ABC transporter permease n=1 Tax=Amaricoccus solimangrovi TaxID=2589815 RepID=A0A501WVI8_9RHOB|nr:amino acid ABC transporter permease [Amaricoccus solimangrovi]TPE50971.1 amino acid ABC transporter permease [Amaricoccus solimangrovi]